MLDEKRIRPLSQALKRIFAMPVGRSTFRELQNTIGTHFESNRDEANTFLESLLRGEIKPGLVEESAKPQLQDLIDRYSVPAWVAKDVHEKGEFINLITSDILTQNNQVVFANRIKRVDGSEFQFLTEPESMIQLLQHFFARVQELDKNDRTRQYLARVRPRLETLRQNIDELLGAKAR